MKIIQIFIRTVLIVAFILILAKSEYTLFVVDPQYAKPQSGTVLYSHDITGRLSDCTATVQFDNGDIQDVNTGNYLYSKGDRFVGQLDYNVFLGLSGLAYSWSPNNRSVFCIGELAVLFNIVFGLVLIFSILAFAIKGTTVFKE